MSRAEERLQEAIGAFDLGAPLVGAVRFGQGHINDTFCIHTQPPEGDCKRFILQRVSNAAFGDPEKLMKNLVGVTDYLRRIIVEEGGDPARETLTFLRTVEGKSYFTDTQGRAWRCTPFIEGTLCHQSAETPELFAASARAFGRFQHRLRDYPADTLFETISQFHDTEDRLQKLKRAAQSDATGRLKCVGPELEFALARQADCSVAMEALRSGKLPLRVTHNDTKLNNVLMDRESGEGVCVIDLDTVMPGLAINDFGDSIRFGANHAAEDERDLSKVNFDLELYEVYVKGFLEGCDGSLTEEELAYLPWGAKLMTLECGMRFLTDYLEGDHYFAVHREGQNLDRCRTQFKLVSDMEKVWGQMSDVVRKFA